MRSIVVLMLIVSCSAYSQYLLPKPIPCIEINDENIGDFLPIIKAEECIESIADDNIIYPAATNVELIAGDYIELSENTIIEPAAAGSFTACINQPSLDVVWYTPNSTPGTVPKYEKLELGVRFNDTIEAEILNFVSGSTGTTLNPYEPLEVDLKAEFWWYNEGTGIWFGPVQTNGFYFEDYQRGVDDWDKDEDNDYHFRVRVAPDNEGLWKCKVSAEVAGHGTYEAADFYFNCVPSSNPGYLRVGDNNRYFRVGDEPFFPIGNNLESPGHAWLYTDDFLCDPEHYLEYYDRLTKMSGSGANYFRFLVEPWATEIEFEHLGNYTNRLEHAWEFDQLLDTAASLGMYMHYNMQVHYPLETPGYYFMFRWDWSKYGDPYSNVAVCHPVSDSGYCYRRELDLEDPKDFLTNAEAKRYYKNRLRYMIARWGYSTAIGMMELFSEANNIGAVSYFEDVEGVCTRPDEGDWPEGYGKPYENDPIHPAKIMAWQNEMLEYIKNDLGHNLHPLVVSYTGEPDEGGGDLSFNLPVVDVMSYNNYFTTIDKYKKVYDKRAEYDLSTTKNKPLIHSEFGTGIAYLSACDNATRFKKNLIITPFTGVSASLYWGYQFGEDTAYWSYMKPIREFLEGVPLDEENWQVGPMGTFSEDDRCDYFYLRRPSGSNYDKAMGVLHNRTYNYFTNGDTTKLYSPEDSCKTLLQEEKPEDIYLDPINISYVGPNLKLKEMGVLQDY
ncbi:MAG: hypothetical protein MI810_03430, partial [Flavobacteriales bacterium]|nr:hypothetical protein [Flavobacteriales bacterium]